MPTSFTPTGFKLLKSEFDSSSVQWLNLLVLRLAFVWRSWLSTKISVHQCKLLTATYFTQLSMEALHVGVVTSIIWCTRLRCFLCLNVAAFAILLSLNQSTAQFNNSCHLNTGWRRWKEKVSELWHSTLMDKRHDVCLAVIEEVMKTFSSLSLCLCCSHLSAWDYECVHSSASVSEVWLLPGDAHCYSPG